MASTSQNATEHQTPTGLPRLVNQAHLLRSAAGITAEEIYTAIALGVFYHKATGLSAKTSSSDREIRLVFCLSPSRLLGLVGVQRA